MSSTDLTVAVIVERNGRFLLVEEHSRGRLVLTQPGGHIEPGEAPEDAARREAIEEACCDVRVRDLIGAYHWTDPANGSDYLRVVFVASFEGEIAVPRDRAIHAVHWLRYEELAAARERLRSPSVLRCVDDYLAGERQPRSLFAGLAEPERQLDIALASAELLHA